MKSQQQEKNELFNHRANGIAVSLSIQFLQTELERLSLVQRPAKEAHAHATAARKLMSASGCNRARKDKLMRLASSFDVLSRKTATIIKFAEVGGRIIARKQPKGD